MGETQWVTGSPLRELSARPAAGQAGATGPSLAGEAGESAQVWVQPRALAHTGLEKCFLRKHYFGGTFSFFLNSFLEIKFTHDKIHPFKVYSSALSVQSQIRATISTVSLRTLSHLCPQPGTAPLRPKGPPTCFLSPCTLPRPWHSLEAPTRRVVRHLL